MANSILILIAVLLILVIYIAHGLFTMTINDFIEKKIVVKTLWLWLPFHALKRLSKEFSEKYLKQ